MLKSFSLLSLAVVFTLANAQAPGTGSPDPAQSPAPIVRGYPRHSALPPRDDQHDETIEAQPIAGVWLRSESTSTLTTVAATPQHTEIRLDHGRLNVTVHQPAQHSEILIDLPGGKTSLLKDGLYTFNADTNTVRVLHGEAAYIGPSEAAKPVKIKEDHQLSLTGAAAIRSVECYPYELAADLLPPDNHGEPGTPPYAFSYPYAYPLYAGAWGYPYTGFYGYGYPFAFGGYPFAYGAGFGYRGGFGGHYRGFRR